MVLVGRQVDVNNSGGEMGEEIVAVGGSAVRGCSLDDTAAMLGIGARRQ